MRGAPFARNWWLASLRGLLALLVGGAVFLWPVPTVESLLRLFGAYALLDGLLVVVVAVLVASQPGNWSPLGLGGFISVGVGMLFSAQPAGVAPAKPKPR